MRTVRWDVLGVVVGVALGVVLLLLFHVPALVAVLLGVAAAAATCLCWWADHVWKQRTQSERRT